MTSFWLGSAFAGASLVAFGAGVFVGSLLMAWLCKEWLKKTVELKAEMLATVEGQQRLIRDLEAAIVRLKDEELTAKETLG